MELCLPLNTPIPYRRTSKAVFGVDKSSQHLVLTVQPRIATTATGKLRVEIKFKDLIDTRGRALLCCERGKRKGETRVLYTRLQ